MRLALISDVHFGPRATYRGKLRKLSDQAGPLTLAFVERMNREARPDVVINLGDVVEDETPEADRRSYQQFIDILAGLDAPVMHVAGNHELVNLSEDDLRSLWGHEGPLYYSRDVSGVHLVVLHTRHRRATDVHLPQEQIDWLRDDLDQAHHPTLVLSHHPLSDMDLVGNRWFETEPDICLVVERAQARAVLEQSGKVAAAISGHAHWNHLDLISGIPYVTVQSAIENVHEDGPGLAAGTYAIVDVGGDFALIRVFGEQPARYQLRLSPPG